MIPLLLTLLAAGPQPPPLQRNPNVVFRLLPGGGGGSLECSGQLQGSWGETVTFARAGSWVCTRTDGTQVSVGANVPAVEAGGVKSRPATTNLALRSEELDNASWTAVGTPAESANTTVAPSGATTADTIGDDAAGAFEGEQQTLATSAGQPYTLSTYAAVGTGTKLRLSNDGTVCDFTVTSSSARYTCTDTSASGATTVQQILIGNAASDTGNLVLWGAQFNAGSGASDYCGPTAGTSVTCNAETISVSSPLAVADAASYCAGVTVSPTYAWDGTNRALFHFGTAYGAYPSATLFVSTATNNLYWDVYSSGPTLRRFSTTASMPSTTTRVRVCNDNGSLSIYFNGALQAGTATGTGGVWADAPATLFVGSIAGASQLIGGISDFCVGKSLEACQ